jgi:hypothetical protein
MNTCSEAVLVIGFNRPHLLSDLVDHLSEMRPPRVYVAIDGPRDTHPTDSDAVDSCRTLIHRFDWATDVHTRFLETNLGCGLAVSSAIQWFLAHEERGIILEDDVIPHPTFYDFCASMLDRYADDDRVLSINGHNLVPPRGQSRPDLLYRFARYTEMWGWALWRRTWSNYELDISEWRNVLSPENVWEQCGRSAPRSLFWGAMFDMVASGRFDTWDIQLRFAAMRMNQAMVVPNVNLTSNTGFGSDATHFVDRPPSLLQVEPMMFPIPAVDFGVDESADSWLHRHHFQVEMRTSHLLQSRSPSFQEFVDDIRELQRRQ